MSSSLRALLAGILDYAGLFPPANLSLDRAIRNYARHQKAEDKWMLGRFIIPAARLGELAPFQKLFDDDPPFVFSVLGRGGASGDEFIQGLLADLRDIKTFRERYPNSVEVEVFEVKLPDSLIKSGNHHAGSYTLVRAADLIEAGGPPALTPFYEVSLAGDWRQAVQAGVAILQYLTTYALLRMHGPYKRYRPAGFKLRCGGTTAETIPSPEQVASVIVSCRNAGVPLKLTAGLHHPFRHLDSTLNAKAHGFLNIFVAAVLAATRNLDQAQTQAIVEDEDAEHFQFDEEGLTWGEWTANFEEIAGARQNLAVGFGSCSFDEPREDLRALGLL